MASNRDNLKEYFKAGERPTEAQFEELIDNSVNLNDDKANQAEAIAGNSDSKYMTPLKVKNSVEIFAPVKSVNGQTGDINLETTDIGSMRMGIAKHFSWDASDTDIFHIKLPYRTDVDNKMFYLKATGHDYVTPEIIDVTWVGYCYTDGGVNNNLIQTKTIVLGSTTITAGQYIGTDNHIYLWFKLSNTYYATFKIDCMRVGNGTLLENNSVEIIQSPQIQL